MEIITNFEFNSNNHTVYLNGISVIDVPNQDFLKDLATNEQLKALLEKTKSTGIEVMVHFTPTSTFNTASYQHFMESVDVKRHLIVNDQNK